MGATLSFASRVLIALLICAIALALGIAYHPLLFLLLIVALVIFIV
jgi:hypothetical protein